MWRRRRGGFGGSSSGSSPRAAPGSCSSRSASPMWRRRGGFGGGDVGSRGGPRRRPPLHLFFHDLVAVMLDLDVERPRPPASSSSLHPRAARHLPRWLPLRPPRLPLLLRGPRPPGSSR